MGAVIGAKTCRGSQIRVDSGGRSRSICDSLLEFSSATCCSESLPARKEGSLDNVAFLGFVDLDGLGDLPLSLFDGSRVRGGRSGELSTALVASGLSGSLVRGFEGNLGHRGALSDCDRPWEDTLRYPRHVWLLSVHVLQTRKPTHQHTFSIPFNTRKTTPCTHLDVHPSTVSYVCDRSSICGKLRVSIRRHPRPLPECEKEKRKVHNIR